MAANKDAAASRRNFLRSGAMAALAGTVGTAALAAGALEPHPDAELIRLGAQLDLAMAAWGLAWSEGADDCDQIGEVVCGLEDEISKIAPTTLAGLAVKAKMARCANTDPDDMLSISEPISDQDWDMKTLSILIADIERLEEARS